MFMQVESLTSAPHLGRAELIRIRWVDVMPQERRAGCAQAGGTGMKFKRSDVNGRREGKMVQLGAQVYCNAPNHTSAPLFTHSLTATLTALNCT